ncbi:MAG: glycosyltransferase family 39 protein [Cyanobacteria bacterium P01_A01_bin.105]
MRADRFLYLVLVVALIGLFYNLHHWQISITAEAHLAEISREMLRTGDYLHPRLQGIDTYLQPPLTYWILALGQRLWGTNGFGVRFFVQVALALQAVLVFQIALRLLGIPRTALFAGLIYLSMPLVMWSSRVLSVDIFATTFELSAVYWLLVYQLERQPWALYGLYLSLGLGGLTGGGQVLLLPLLMRLYIAIAARQSPLQQWRLIDWPHTLVASFLGLIIGSGWYLYIGFEQPDLWQEIWYQHWRALFPDAATVWAASWQWAVLLGWGALPWLPIFIVGLFGPLWQMPRLGQLVVFWLGPLIAVRVWMGTPTAPTLLPVLAGLSILVAYLLQQLSRLEVRQYGLLFMQLTLAIGLLLLGIPLVSQLLGESLVLSGPMAVTAGLIVLVGMVFFGLIRAGVRFRLVAIALITNLLFLIYGGYLIAANPFWIETTAPLAQFIQDRQLQDDTILVFDQTLPSLAFALDRNLVTINNGTVTPDVTFQTRSAWRQQWVSTQDASAARYLRRLISQSSVLITDGNLPDQLNWIAASYPDVQAVGRWQVHYRPK